MNETLNLPASKVIRNYKKKMIRDGSDSQAFERTEAKTSKSRYFEYLTVQHSGIISSQASETEKGTKKCDFGKRSKGRGWRVKRCN